MRQIFYDQMKKNGKMLSVIGIMGKFVCAPSLGHHVWTVVGRSLEKLHNCLQITHIKLGHHVLLYSLTAEGRLTSRWYGQIINQHP